MAPKPLGEGEARPIVHPPRITAVGLDPAPVRHLEGQEVPQDVGAPEEGRRSAKDIDLLE